MIPALDRPPFRPRFPWWTGNLQSLATAILPAPKDMAPHASQVLRLPLPDGDVLQASLDSPVAPKPGRPAVLLIHGAGGSAASRYMLRASRALLDLGHRVVRLNLRGAGPSRPDCRGQYYAGGSADLASVLALLPDRLAKDGLAKDGLVAVGYSVGGAILLKYLGEAGQETPLAAAASVSAPLDLAATCRNLMRWRNWPSHCLLLRQMKHEALGPGAALTPAERDGIRKARTLWQFDELFTAPRNDFPDAATYYAHCSASAFLGGIRIPTLVMAAQDDPWVPGAAYLGQHWGSYTSHSLLPLLPGQGGHVGFHGVGSPQPWSDLAVAKFLAWIGPPTPASARSE